MWFLALTLAAHADTQTPPPADPPPEAAPSDETPLAIPPAPPPARRGPPPRPGTMDAARLHALREYRARHIELRRETERHGGGAEIIGWSTPYWGWMGHASVMRQPVVTTHSWGVYQGPQRLDVPQFLDITGQTELQATLAKDIHHARVARTAWFSTAGVGVAGVLVGIVGMNMADTQGEWRDANTLTFGGSLLAITGLVGASFPSAKLERLIERPSTTLTMEQARTLADKHNEALREELKLTPREVWAIESRR